MTPRPPIAAIDYRKADLSDVAIVAGLPRPGEAGGASADRMARYLAGVHHPQEALPSRAMWIAAQGETPIGYIAGHLTRRFACDGELQWIYVVPQHRRTGVASTLLRLLADWFVEQEARRVCVDVGDDSARPFYWRHGAVGLNRHWMVWEDIGSALSSWRNCTLTAAPPPASAPPHPANRTAPA
jgi:GNAT superfamily N-acetyltransferase